MRVPQPNNKGGKRSMENLRLKVKEAVQAKEHEKMSLRVRGLLGNVM
jgi:hypothetical protein